MKVKNLSFGFGSIFSLIIVYFIFKYSESQGWTILAFISKWYLIIVGGLMLLSVAIVIFFLLFSLLMFVLALFKLKGTKKEQKEKHYVDVDYKVKE